MFSIFTKKKNYDLGWLGVDIHSHLLPGVDDGAKDLATSLFLLEGLQDLGLQKFYTTPHIYSEIYPNTADTLRAAQQRWKEESTDLLASKNRNTENWPVVLAAEYMIDDQFVKAYTEQDPLVLPDRHILVEMSYLYERKDLQDQLFQLQIQEFKPVLAHPERYTFYHANPQVITKIRNRGCQLQLNILSLAGYYGNPVRKLALQLVREGMIDYVGTDLHHTRHLQAIQEFARQNDVQKLLSSCTIKNQHWL